MEEAFEKMKDIVNRLASVYKLECLSITKAEDGTLDIELNRLLVRGDWSKLEKKIRRSIPNAGSIFVKEKF